MSDKRQVILDAAESLLAQYGFHGFSMKQLARHAGMAAGTVYLYFQDKETLIRELHRSLIARLGKEWFAGLPTDLPVPAQFEFLWLRLWEVSLSASNRLMCKSQFDSLPPDSYQALVEHAEAGLQPLFHLIAQARRQNLVKPLPDGVLVSLWMEPCIALARKQLTGMLMLNDAELQAAAEASWDAIAC